MFAIFAIERPTSTKADDALRWQHLAEQAKHIASGATGIETLGENVWQIDLRHALARLGSLMEAATGAGMQHRILFFDREPAWCRSSPSP